MSAHAAKPKFGTSARSDDAGTPSRARLAREVLDAAVAEQLRQLGLVRLTAPTAL